MVVPSLYASTAELLTFYFGEECAGQITETVHLIPLMFSHEIIKKVMCIVLADKPNMCMIDLPLQEVLKAFHFALQYDGSHHEYYDFKRDAELGFYLHSARSILPFANLENCGELCLQKLREGLDERCVKPPASAMTLSDLSLPVHKKTIRGPYVHSNQTTNGSSELVIMRSSISEKHVNLDCNSHKNIDISYPFCNEAGNNKQLNPSYLSNMLMFSGRPLVDIIKQFLTNNRGSDVFERTDRSDAVAVFQALRNESLKYIYFLYKGSSKQGETFVLPQYHCIYCRSRGVHFSTHCLRFLDRQMRIEHIIRNKICCQCGQKEEKCSTPNRHRANEFSCKNCRMENNNHKNHLCNSLVRWSKGGHSSAEGHDLYQFAKDMSLIARATTSWTDREWHTVFTDTNCSQVRNYFNVMSTRSQESLLAQGFLPRFGLQQSPHLKSSEVVLPISTFDDYIPLHEKEELVVLPEMVNCTYLSAVIYCFVLNKSIRNRLLRCASSESQLVIGLFNISQVAVEVSQGLSSSLELHKVWSSFRVTVGRAFQQFAPDAERNPIALLTCLIDNMSLQSHENPCKSFAFEVLERHHCFNCGYNSQAEINIVHEYIISLAISDDHYARSMSDHLSCFFKIPRKCGICHHCQHGSRFTTLKLVNPGELLIVTVVRFKKIEDSSCKTMKSMQPFCDMSIELHSGHIQKFSIKMVVCFNYDERQMEQSSHRVCTFYKNNNGVWYRFDKGKVTQVNSSEAESICDHYGCIYIFHKK